MMAKKRRTKEPIPKWFRIVLVVFVVVIGLALSAGAARLAYLGAYWLAKEPGPTGVLVIPRGSTVEGHASSSGLWCAAFVGLPMAFLGIPTILRRLFPDLFKSKDGEL